MCTHTGPRPSVITVERCCLDWSDKGSSVTVRETGRWSVKKKTHFDVVCIFLCQMKCKTHQICSIFPSLLLCCLAAVPACSLIHAAPCRMWTELPQALCIQHPEQLQWSSQTASIHHLPEQQPVPASLHHWVGVQCRDGLHLHRRCCSHPLTHTNGTELIHAHSILVSCRLLKWGRPPWATFIWPYETALWIGWIHFNSV